MPRAGRYVYPQFKFDFVIERLKEAYEAIRDLEMDRSAIAHALGRSERGGAFTYLLAAWEDLGLTENREGKVTLTELGQRVLTGDEKAKSEAAGRIEMFKELYEAYGIEPDEKQVETWLVQRARLSPLKAKELAPIIRRIYLSYAEYLKPDTVLAPLPEARALSPAEKVPAAVPETRANLLRIQYGDVFIQVPKGDREAIKLAKAALEFMEKYEEETKA